MPVPPAPGAMPIQAELLLAFQEQPPPVVTWTVPVAAPAGSDTVPEGAMAYVQGALEVKLTAKPELAVALMANGATPSITLLNAPNVIVCEAWKLTARGRTP